MPAPGNAPGSSPASGPSRALDLHIRQATPDDSADIAGMIRELAVFEKLEDQCLATPESIRESVFAEPPVAYALIAQLGQDVAGFALYFLSYSTFLAKPGVYLEDLYVRAPYRRQGVGKTLLRAVAKQAVAMDAGRLEWAVLDWNQNAIDLYRAVGAEPQGGWTTMRLTGQALPDFAQAD